MDCQSTTTDSGDKHPEHPLGKWIESRYPGVQCKTIFCRWGIYIDHFVVEVPSGSLSNTAYKVLRDCFRYANWSGETICGEPRAPDGYQSSAERLIKLYTRCGAAWDEDKGLMMYPPERANSGYQPLARGSEKYEGIL